ncbi:saccharopine dehydrogenase-like oxidoreductase [Dendroctonus ponderosae]|uniref:Saccharopine dehydrogenase NADP binding domain-containing protein n=1 Tax=Dendroctonus ponderosae TaxID=77166 RepID=U4UYQ2_DENPD|nr:saccharopine dehydrogenase-like oxidoreductase [Dendroctonus ponderosae]XP_019765372.2 saccharopine dehydrogenase-like oxidoreductase [Dendroctonus ponderosae]ERL95526.1 hypothetical protein D910_12788 [Dendroctonus ponderosae]KAH1029828.1 hypothetical protein HUJ05_002988 [Dendroctonus ponderosae]
MTERLDILILGATGFTGSHCIPYIAKLSKENGRNLSWGVAGRSEEKLKNVLKEYGDKLELDFGSIPVVIVDIKDEESLLKMAKAARLVINCCGPYRFFGDAVVKACIEAGTHHIDVSGEPEYMETVQVKQHDAAKEKGLYIVSACGFDSIPADLGVIFMQQNFEGTLNSIETFMRTWTEKSCKGPSVNYGTWESAVYGLSNSDNLREVRKEYAKKFDKVAAFAPKLPRKNLPHKPKTGEGWALPFLGADRSVATRSQQYLYENDNIRPVQVGTYVVFPSAIATFVVLLYAIIFAFLSKFEFGRKLLLDYPQCFSGGYFSKKPPSEENINSARFSIDFYGEGWKEKLASKDDQYTTPVDTFIRGQVKGNNPGYGATCACLVLSAIVVLTETDKLANNGKGGVFSPGAAFAKTSLVKQLNENGVTFEILEQGEIKRD